MPGQLIFLLHWHGRRLPHCVVGAVRRRPCPGAGRARAPATPDPPATGAGIGCGVEDSLARVELRGLNLTFQSVYYSTLNGQALRGVTSYYLNCSLVLEAAVGCEVECGPHGSRSTGARLIRLPLQRNCAPGARHMDGAVYILRGASLRHRLDNARYVTMQVAALIPSPKPKLYV